jgi:hypothetical protein
MESFQNLLRQTPGPNFLQSSFSVVEEGDIARTLKYGAVAVALE